MALNIKYVQILLSIFIHTLGVCRAEICLDSHCHFELEIRQRRSMTYTTESGVTHNVAWNSTYERLQVIENDFHKKVEHPIIGEFVDADDVITTDGNTRNIYVINEQFPGPRLEVMEGAQVTVVVRNHLSTEGLTIHFHGIDFKNNVWMDGTGYISQCPVLPGQSFEYRFEADVAGTYWYHGHFRSARIDGMYGAFLVHRRVPALPYHVIELQDWYRNDALTVRVMNPYDPEYRGTGETSVYVLHRDYSVDGNELSAMRYESTLIGGRGRVAYDAPSDLLLPLASYNVVSGTRVMFHMIHTGADFTYEVMVDEHKLIITALDGYELRRVEVDSFHISPGERVDFEIEASGVEGLNYWIRAETIRHGKGLPIVVDGIIKGQKAILSYNTNTTISDPESMQRNCTQNDQCVVFNCPFLGYRDDQYKICLTINDVESAASDAYLQAIYGVEDQDIEEYFLNWGYHIGVSVNGRKFAYPTAPYSGNNSAHTLPCDDTLCDSQGCYCTYAPVLPYNRTVQLVLSNYHDSPYVGHHTMHLHGHSSAVMKTGYAEYNSTTGLWSNMNEDVTCSSFSLCTDPGWSGDRPVYNDKPVIRDTVVVPARGYVIMRFRTLNPGYWLLHCHQESHMEEGMAMLFNEAPGFHPPVPQGFPTCGDFRLQGLEPDGAPDRSGEDNRRDRNKDDNNDEYLRLSKAEAIGSFVGFVLLGAVVATLPIMVYICCQTRRINK